MLTQNWCITKRLRLGCSFNGICLFETSVEPFVHYQVRTLQFCTDVWCILKLIFSIVKDVSRLRRWYDFVAFEQFCESIMKCIAYFESMFFFFRWSFDVETWDSQEVCECCGPRWMHKDEKPAGFFTVFHWTIWYGNGAGEAVELDKERNAMFNTKLLIHFVYCSYLPDC